MKKISQKRRQDIVKKLKEGLTHRQIAHQLGVGVGTVSSIRKAVAAELPKPKVGRPKKLGFHHHRFLDRLFLRKTVTSVREACKAFKEFFNTPVSRTTMRKELRKMKFKARVMVKRPLLAQHHKGLACAGLKLIRTGL